jgi:hypothetical protein
MHPTRPVARGPRGKKRAPPKVAPQPPPFTARLLDSVTSLRSAIFLAALVLILAALAVRQASTQKLHADGPPDGGTESPTGPFIAAGEAEFQDPARNLLESIIDREFESRGQVIVERLRPDFEQIAADLEQLDLGRIRALRRGKDWVLLTAPTRTPESDPADEPSETAIPPTIYQLRLVRQENVWKLDRVKKLETGES